MKPVEVSSGAISVETLVNRLSKQGIFRTYLIAFLSLSVLGTMLSYSMYKKRAQVILESNLEALAHSVSIGDYFQLKRQIGSLVDSKHIHAMWVFESMHGRLAAYAGTHKESLKQQNGPDLSHGKLLIYQSMPLNTSPGIPVGKAVVSVAIPWMNIFGAPALLLFFFWILSIVLTRNMSYIALTLSEGIKELVGAIDLKSEKSSRSTHPRIIEVERVIRAISIWKKNERTNARAEVLQQVGHDIRSPLSVASIAASHLPEGKEKVLIQSAVRKISEISATLSGKSKSPIGSLGRPSTNPLVAADLANLINESKFRTSTAQKIDFGYKIQPDTVDAVGLIDTLEFRRVIDNAITNSLEAIEGQGSINIECSLKHKMLLVSITDTGKGIPSEFIDKVTDRGFTYGKSSGTGLGLSYIKTVVEKHWKGQFKIRSTEGTGTTLTLSFPIKQRATWVIHTIKLKKNSRLFVLDDDASFILAWKEKFRNLSDVHYFTDENLFAKDLANKERIERQDLFFLDYQLGENRNGIDVAMDNHIAKQTILVTNAYDREQVIEKCIRAGIKILPKPLLQATPITA